MKFGKVGQVVLVSAIALIVASLFTACSTLTVGFLFVSTTKQTPGQMEVYEVNSESGVLRQIPTSPFPSGGRNPIAEAVNTATQNLYVVNNDDNSIVQFGIGTDGKLYPQSTVNTPGTFPMSVALNAAGSFLYVVDQLEPVAGCSLGNPCPGDIAVFPVNSDGSLGAAVTNNSSTPNYWPLTLTATNQTVLTPTAMYVTPNGNNIYVSAYNATTKAGYLFGYTANSDGTLTAIPMGCGTATSGCTVLPLSVGSEPVAIAGDTGGANLYVADQIGNQVHSFAVGSGGLLSAVSNTATGAQPAALTLFNDKYLYVANSQDSTVTAYNVNAGSLSKIGTYTSSTNPIAIAVDPRNLGFLYTVNFLGNSISGYEINQTDGSLVNTQATPYASSVQPTAITGVPHAGTNSK
ncbi:MAG TPA: beta-propeller fold lactonase family protein [Acidobacteriaceae bacterium]|jgi:6-phosphogluconolactonase (cycloisomerase 2 family)|nr:beta-propeller fold lactonase family protein [Acidobacteriaceae bacterium]